jgi:hypothetical protein
VGPRAGLDAGILLYSLKYYLWKAVIDHRPPCVTRATQTYTNVSSRSEDTFTKSQSNLVWVRFQFLTAASMKATVFWDVASCSLVEVY